MDSQYVLVIFWFFFACLTFGCIVGGDEPKKWHTPTKAQAFKAWIIAIFWPIVFVWLIFQWTFSITINFLWNPNSQIPWWWK